MLTFFDLANVGSVSAVMTEDLGYVERGRVRVLGRAAGEARGCALGIGQFSATEAAEDIDERHISVQARCACRKRKSVAPCADRMADALARAFELWRDRDYVRRRDTIAAIADSAGYSVAMLENSIDALLKPFTSDALKAMAARVSGGRQDVKPKTVGFIAAGNVAGAGIHEIAIALIAGARVLIKTASAEPIFFAEFARTLAEVDREAGARVEVLNWSRARTDLTDELIAKCDRVVAYGDDATIESLRSRSDVIGFGSRVSAALSMRPASTASQNC